jgi:hydroxyacylglutathione hydrolase
MYIEQIYTNCLAHAAYYIESGKEAAVIDPLRDPEPYIQLAKERGATIKYVLETHFHADFVSGHIDLANKTGAIIVFGPNATPEYKAYIADDGELLVLGDTHLKILHTPGHTIESTSYLLLDKDDRPNAVFTGDTLFVGDVGRPDLLSGNLQKEELAAMLFDSLRLKIKSLPDEVIVYPGHGAGSACGKNIGINSFSTIGEEKNTNYALLANDKQAFIDAITSDLPAIPAYFFKDAAINKAGCSPYDDVIKNNVNALSAREFIETLKTGCLVLDTRDPMDFAAGFIFGAINIGLTGDFAVWVGTMIDAETQLLLIAEPGKEKEAVERLARIGYENVLGYLQGGMHSWFNGKYQYDRIMTFDGRECEELLEVEQYFLLDVRNRREVAKHRLTGSVHIPLNQLKENYRQLEPDKKWLVYCAGGYRSMIAASFLKANKFHFIASIEGGINDVIKHSPQLVDIEIAQEA